MKILYNSLEEIKQAVIDGKLVNWQNGLYFVKLDFEGDFVIKCTSSPMQELLSTNHNVNDFFTNQNTL